MCPTILRILNTFPYKKGPKHRFLCKWSIEGVLSGVNLRGESQAKMCFQKPSLSVIPRESWNIKYTTECILLWKEVPGLGILSHLYPGAFDMLKNSPEKGTGVSFNQSTPTAARGWVQQLVKKFWVGYQKHQLHWGRKGSRYPGKISSHFWHSQVYPSTYTEMTQYSLFALHMINTISICWVSNEYSFFMAFF